MRRSNRSSGFSYGLLLALFGLVAPFAPATTAAANRFDVIFADTVDVTLCLACGYTLAGLDYGLIVNAGATDITLDELASARVTASTSNPAFPFHAFINIPDRDLVGSIAPGEAIGSVLDGNRMLLEHLRPEERFRNLATPLWGSQFMAYQIFRYGDYVGPVDLAVRIELAGERVEFTIHANMQMGAADLTFLGASRASSMPIPEPGTAWMFGTGLALLACGRTRPYSSRQAWTESSNTR